MSETLANDVSAPTRSAVSGGTASHGWLDRTVTAASEQLNPILVKEARQALKSRQFLVTFSLLLTCAWIWSLIGVSLLTPGVYFAPSGTFMLVGYFLTLVVPLVLIVPFSAFWSLAGEREDGTLELVSITKLSSRQIVTGKLGSAILQMIVYYSAVAPCIAFTYLLRGVDVVVIFLVLAYTFVVSLLLSLVGLVLAALTRAKHWQMLVAVVFLLGLVAAGIAWAFSMIGFATAGANAVDDPEFWIVQTALLFGAASYFFILLTIAAAQLSFSTDNRSTKLRIAMLMQLVGFTGFMWYMALNFADDDVIFATVTIAALHWFIYGAMMNGEVGELSPRAKRRLPQTFTGRMLLTWFNPGAETGYIFVVTTFTAFLLLLSGAYAFDSANGGVNWNDRYLTYAVLIWAYLTFYLGLGRFLVAGIRRFSQQGIFIPFLAQAVMMAAAAVVPTFFQSWLEGFEDLTYSPLQAPNWCWSLAEAADGRRLAYHSEVTVAMTALALGVLAVHLVLATREIHHVRTLVPLRVLEDEAPVAVETPVAHPLDASSSAS